MDMCMASAGIITDPVFSVAVDFAQVIEDI